MLTKITFDFLKKLKANNHKDWFDANRDKYTAAKAEVEAMAAALIKYISKFDPSIAHLQAKDCLFRINRDVRFSKNKAPYKTNMSIYISSKGKKAMDVAGYYVHIEPGSSFMAAGIWMPMAPELKKIRQEIDYNYDAFSKIISNKKFKEAFGDLDKSEGTVLSRPPKGYEADNAAIEYLKHKSFIASKPLPDNVLQQKDAAATIAADYKILHPFIAFLNEALMHEEH